MVDNGGHGYWLLFTEEKCSEAYRLPSMHVNRLPLTAKMLLLFLHTLKSTNRQQPITFTCLRMKLEIETMRPV